MRATIGGVLLISGIALVAWTKSILGWRRLLCLTDEPPHPALPRLVFAGPYRVVRHPLCLSALLLLLGAAVVTGSVALALAFAVAAFALPLIAWQQEQRLLERFGDAYQRYRKAIPFLLPPLSRWGTRWISASTSSIRHRR
jgi:methanethiol S-methyltransferase